MSINQKKFYKKPSTKTFLENLKIDIDSFVFKVIAEKSTINKSTG